MTEKDSLTIQEFARSGGLAWARKHSKQEIREWGKHAAKPGRLGGRPKKQEEDGRSQDRRSPMRRTGKNELSNTEPILTITEFARMGGRATLRKYGKRQLREWGKLGGRPRKRKSR